MSHRGSLDHDLTVKLGRVEFAFQTSSRLWPYTQIVPDALYFMIICLPKPSLLKISYGTILIELSVRPPGFFMKGLLPWARHDSVVIKIIVDAEPYGLFSPLILASATSINGDLYHARDRQGLVPDFHITFPAQHGPSSYQLAELKCISAGVTWYSSDPKAVDQWANGLPKLYLDKAQNIDRKYCHTNPNDLGPLEASMERFLRTSMSSSNVLSFPKMLTSAKWRASQSPTVNVSLYPSSRPRATASCPGSTKCLQGQRKLPKEGLQLNKETVLTRKTAVLTLKLTFEVADFET